MQSDYFSEEEQKEKRKSKVDIEVLQLNSCRLPCKYKPGTDLISKHVLRDEKIMKKIITHFLGQQVQNHYRVGDPGWIDRTTSDVVYIPTKHAQSLPPFLIEIQKTVDESFMDRVNQYSLNIKKECGVKPIVIIFTVGKIEGTNINEVLAKDENYKYMSTIPSYPWASVCYILSKHSIKQHIQKNLNIMTAIELFLTKQKLSISDLEERKDPLIQLLYSVAFEKVEAKCDVENKDNMIRDTLADIEKKMIQIDQHLEADPDALKNDIKDVFETIYAYHLKDNFDMAKSTMRTPKATLLEYREFVVNFKNRCKIEHKRFLWEKCFEEGENKGLFKEYNDSIALLNAYNKYIKHL